MDLAKAVQEDKDFDMSKIKITVVKLTDVSLAQRACSFTMQLRKESKITLDKLYRCEHSPMKTQLFWIEFENIPSYVSVHFVRHTTDGRIESYVGSNREDITGADPLTINRLTPVSHAVLVNANCLVRMARQRLCKKADVRSQYVMNLIRNEVQKIDVALAKYMVPNCVYRNKCVELRSCGSCIQIMEDEREHERLCEIELGKQIESSR